MEIDVLPFEQLRKFISEITFTEIEKIEGDTLLFQEGIFDSLGFLSLIGFLSDEFGIDVSNEELTEDNFESIDAVVKYISQKKDEIKS